MNQPQEEKDPLLSIEHELYDPRAKIESTEIHSAREMRSLNLPSSWGEDAPVITKTLGDTRTSFGTKFFLAATLFLFLALGFTAWNVISQQNIVSAEYIDMGTEITPFVEGGEPTPLAVTLRNRNKVPLESVSITVMYKEGNGSQDEQEKVSEKREIGTLLPNELKLQDFKVVVYGSEREARDIVVKLEYKVAGSNALFTKLITTEVVLRSSPILVTIEGPDSISLGQEVMYRFIVKNNVATTSLPSRMQATIPSTFNVVSTNPTPRSKDLVWDVPSLKQGEEKTFEIVGYFSGKEDEKKSFQAKVGGTGGSQNSLGIIFSSYIKDLTTKSTPLVISSYINSDRVSGETIRLGDRARVIFSYHNASNEVLENVKLSVTFSGDAPSYKDISPIEGYYNSLTKTISWDKDSLPVLAVLSPGAKGELSVLVPIVSIGNNSPTMKAVFTGTALTKGNEHIESVFSKTWAVEGVAILEASTQYKNSPFPNVGPIPPIPNQDTSYTIHIDVVAQNPIKNTRVSFVLPVYVSYRDVTTGGSQVIYNPKTRTVTWNIGELPATKVASVDIGVLTRPSQSHVGQSPAITSGVVLEAEEEVSRVRLKTTLSPLTTTLRNEAWEEDPSRVVDR